MSEHGSPERPDGPFPPDEFDDLPPADGRRGAHRARPNPVLAMLPVLLVVVVVVALAVGAMTLLGDGGLADPPSQEQDPAAPTATGPAAGPPVTPPATDATAAPSPPPVEAEVDRTVPVEVLNGTQTAGLAGGAVELLGAAGWTELSAGNYTDGDPPPTTVYYPDEELASAAEALAVDLGGAATELSDDVEGSRLTVVLGEDYVP